MMRIREVLEPSRDQVAGAGGTQGDLFSPGMRVAWDERAMRNLGGLRASRSLFLPTDYVWKCILQTCR